MILTGQLASPTDVHRFHTEAKAAANLDHPNILPIYEVGEHEGHQYFSMKLVEGGSLSSKIDLFLAQPRAAATLAAKLARAVHFAHQRGILHRDLKPANILIDIDGTPYVTDFGLAKNTTDNGGLTHTGAVVGTPSYMAPEQARAEKQLTTAVDVYSLGAILYELIAGRAPFRANTVYETIKSVIEVDAPNARSLNPKADRDLAAIAGKCLSKRPEDRYRSAEELADDLERWIAGGPTKARPPSGVGLIWRWLRANATTACTVVLVGMLWGLLCGVGLLAAQTGDVHRMKYLAEGKGSFNPLGWATGLRDISWATNLVVGLAVTFCLTIGWIVRAGIRPRTAASALGAAGAIGLIAALLANLFVSPAISTEIRANLYPLRAQDPPMMRFNPDQTIRLIDAEFGGIHPDLDYLATFLPPEKRDPSQASSAQAYVNVFNNLKETNRLYASTIGIWISQFFTLFLFLFMSLLSTWTVDVLARSDRRLLTRILSYMELYPFSLLLLIATIAAIAVLMIVLPGHVTGSPPWQVFACQLGMIALIVFNYVAVFRRWPLIVHIGLLAMWLSLLGWVFVSLK